MVKAVTVMTSRMRVRNLLRQVTMTAWSRSRGLLGCFDDCLGSVVLSLELRGSLFVKGLICHVCFSVSGCLGGQ